MLANRMYHNCYISLSNLQSNRTVAVLLLLLHAFPAYMRQGASADKLQSRACWIRQIQARPNHPWARCSVFLPPPGQPGRVAVYILSIWHIEVRLAIEANDKYPPAAKELCDTKSWKAMRLHMAQKRKTFRSRHVHTSSATWQPCWHPSSTSDNIGMASIVRE